jgi:hypothetical protein
MLFSLGWPQTQEPLASAFQVPELQGVCHHAWISMIIF